jgi:hypothetical protein
MTDAHETALRTLPTLANEPIESRLLPAEPMEPMLKTLFLQ